MTDKITFDKSRIPNDVALYTVTEVSKILKTNRSYVYELINSGNLPCVKIGHIKIRHDALAKFLSQANACSTNYEVQFPLFLPYDDCLQRRKSGS